MASVYPGTLDTFVTLASTDEMDDAGKEGDVLINNLHDAMEQVQSTLGTDPQGASATVKARINVAAKKTITLRLSSGSTLAVAAGKINLPLPIAGTITAWRLVADQSTTTTVDVWKAAGSLPSNANTITASAKPALSGASVASSSTLTGWTTSVAAGDVIELEVEANSAATALTLVLEMDT